MNDDIASHMKDSDTWIRLLFMLLFAVFYSIAEIVLLVVVFFQFLFHLVTGKRNGRALAFGAQLSTYVYQVFRYLTYNTEDRPFPFADWPGNAALVPAKGRPRKQTAEKAKAEPAGESGA